MPLSYHSSLKVGPNQLISFKMVVTRDITLPSDEELTVQEVNVSTPGLRAAAFHMGKYCESVNNVSKV